MEAKTEHDELMIRYLLGQVTEEERTTVEQRFLEDAEYFAELLSVEETLLDDYSAGKLSEGGTGRVEEYLLTSRYQAGELEFNRNLIATVRQLPRTPEQEPGDSVTFPTSPLANESASVPVPHPIDHRLPEISSRRKTPARPMPVWAIAVAAAIAVIAIASTVYLRNELTVLREQYADLAKQNEEMLQRMEPPFLSLAPSSQLRSGGGQVPSIEIRGWMRSFVLKLRIDNRSLRRYSVLIERVGQKLADPPVWKSEFGAGNITEQGTFDLSLQARDFTATDYIVTIQGLEPDRAPLTQYYSFRVER